MTDDQVLHRDRIAQAFLGAWGSRATQARARRRVKWMASQVQGSRVVDLGCSEGIVPILLARRGFEVTGVDVNADAIAYARDLVEEEAPLVRERLNFVVADAYSFEADVRGYDCVVLGEVIEHLRQPEKMIARAAELLREGGRLVLTTPFGFLPHDDHHQAFMPSELRHLFAGRFRLEFIDSIDSYFRIVAVRDPSAPGLDGTSAEADLAMTERAIVEQQRRLYAELADLRQRHRDASQRYMQVSGELETILSSIRYPLGSLLVEAVKSPSRFFSLPRDLLALLRRHRQRKDLVAKVGPERAKGAALDDGPVPAVDIPATEVQPREPRSPVKIAVIFDSFSARCFQFEAKLIFLQKETWQAQLEAERPDFFFAESAWHGNDRNWSRLFQDYALDESNPLRALLRYCRSANIPSVFWNKEDPPNFNVFIDAAKGFDYIFTSDSDCIERYKTLCGHDRVACLQFAAQPAIHNPIDKSEDDELEVAFAGTWYARKHKERSALLPILLDASLSRELIIFDRMSEHRIDNAYKFPAKYQRFRRRALTYDQMLTAHRRFKLFLNPNSVVDSPTMFSRRVFEVLACSTPVVSTASRGVENTFADTVPLVHSTDVAKSTINQILDDDAYRGRLGHIGYRKVMREHTYEVRLRQILIALGITEPSDLELAKATIILPLSSPACLSAAAENAKRQSYPNLEVLAVASKDVLGAVQEDALADTAASVRWLEAPAGGSRAMALCAAMEAATGDYLTVFAENDIYGENYVWDLLLPFAFSEAGVVGKGAHFAQPGEAGQLALRQPGYTHQCVDRLEPAAMMIDRQVLSRVSISSDDPDPIEAFLESCCRAEIPLYAADPYNYVRICPGDLSQGSETPEVAIKLSDVMF